MEGTATLKSYLELGRVSNLPTVWTNVLAAALLADAAVPPGEVVLLCLSLSFFYVGGMALNDLCDREHDRVHRPGRPIPSGRVAPGAAAAFTAALFAGGFLALMWTACIGAVFGGAALCVAIVCYDLRHKGNPLSVLLMGSCRFLVFVVASLAVSGIVAPLAALAGGVQFLYVVAISLVARREHARGGFSLPVVPLMLAGISLVDGIVLAGLVDPVWFSAGAGGYCLTLAGQRLVRGD